MRNLFKEAVCAAALAAAAASSAATATYNGVTYETSGFTPGKWTSDFDAAKAYADKNNTPLLVFWGSQGCGWCKRMIQRGLTQSPFTTWMASHAIAYVFVDVPDSQTSRETTVKKFAKNSTGQWPYMRIYWKKADGSTVNVGFTGRKGYITQGGTGSEAQQLVNSLNYYVGSWKPSGTTPVTPTPTPVVSAYAGGDFQVPGTAAARLEMVKNETASLVVPLVRTNTTNVAATNVLVYGSAQTTVAWAANETRKEIKIDVSALNTSNLALTLKTSGTNRATTTVYSVSKPANSTKNPAWIGEDFGYGEWTMDLDAAKAAGSRGNGTLVFFTGALWCPWCLGLENYVFDTAEFRSWAKENKIALALLDNLKRSANDNTASNIVSTVANGAGPSLLSYATGANGASGAAYMSRHGISTADANARLAANHTLGYFGGAYCAPDALRTGYPTLILLDRSGAIRGRFSAQFDSTSAKDANGAYPANKAENLARLEEFAKLVDADIVAENDKYVSKTTLKHKLGDSASLRLGVSEKSAVYKLEGFTGEKATFTVTGDTAGKGVTLELLRQETATVTKKNASGATASTATFVRGASVASTTGSSLLYVFPSSGTYFLKVSSYADSGSAKYGSSGVETTVSFKSESTPEPTENNFTSKAFTATLSVYSQDGATLAGTLAVTSTKRGKITAKYVRAGESRTTTARGSWGEADFYGVAKAALSAKGIVFNFSIAASGEVSAEVKDGSTTYSAPGTLAVDSFSKYAGYYTVALPVTGVSGKKAWPTGAGYVLVKANSSSFLRKGKASCKVLLPDGRTLSANAVFEPTKSGWARLSIIKRSSQNSVAIAMKIRPNAANAVTKRAVIAQDGVASTWNHSKSGVAYTLKLGVYGSIYNKYDSLVDCCGTDALYVDYATANFANSERYGALKSVTAAGAELTVSDSSIRLKNTAKGFTVRFNKSTGVVRGSTKVQFANKEVRATFQAVLIPDWADCGCYEPDPTVPLTADIPAVFGSCWYSDKINGKTERRGFEIGFKIEE